MTKSVFDHGEKPDPTGVQTRQDFTRELTLLREQAGHTVRDVAKAVGIPNSTAGGYFGGRHLPPITIPNVLTDIVRFCGVVDPAEIDEWRLALVRVRRQPGPRPTDAPTPYRGLESFQPEHAEWFHGRERLTTALVSRVISRRSEGGPVIVVGPSGSGKSSLLRAGLIPTLAQSRNVAPMTWTSVLTTPGAHPMAEFAKRLESLDPVPRDGQLIVVDQFEELFTLCTSETERREYIAALCAVASRPGPATSVVLGMRADFYPQASRYPELVCALQEAQIVVGPMTADEVRQAIVEPARQARLDVDDGLVELLLRDIAPRRGDLPGEAHDVGALPLLSHALLATWQRAQRGRLTIADYQATGGISGAIACTADAVYDLLTERQRDIARHLFLQLVHLGDRAADTRRRVPYAEIMSDDDEVAQVLDLFVEQRLLTVDADAVDITHEALLSAWPQLRGWIDSDRADLRVHRQLAHDARVWSEAGRDQGGLYRGGRLATAQDWSADPAHRRNLSLLEHEFLDASVAQQASDQRSRQRRTRQLRRLVAALTVLVLVAGALTAYVFRQRTDAIAQRDMAISRQVAGEANQLRDHDVALAMQLSLAAYRISPTSEARASLLDTTGNSAATRILSQEGATQTIAFTPDGRVMAAGGTDTTVQLWRLGDNPRAVRLGQPLRGPTDTVYSLSFDRSGTRLAAGGGDKAVRLWDVSDPAQPSLLGAPLAGARNTIYSVAFSPDGRVLAAASADKDVHLWDISDSRRPVPLAPLTGFTNYVQSVVFSPDGHTLAAGGADGTVRLWDVTDLTRPVLLGVPLTGAARKVLAVAISPDGRTLAAGSADKNVYTWDIADRVVAQPVGSALSGAGSWVNAVAFSPDGRTLAAGSSDNNVRLWTLATRTTSHLLPHPGPITAAVFTDDGNTLATGAADGVVRLWVIPGPVMADAIDSVFNVQFGPDGTVLATASGAADGQFRLWDVKDSRRPRMLGKPVTNPHAGNHFIGTADLSPDGRTLAAGGLDGRVQLWDIEDPAHPVPLGEPLSGRFSPPEYLAFSFSSDSRLLAFSGEDNAVWLWDISDRMRPRPVSRPLTGPTNYVYSLAFSPDNKTLAGGSLDKTTWLWDVSDIHHTKPVATLTGPANYVYSVAFSPDGKSLAVGSADKSVRIWDITDQAHPALLGQPLAGPTNYVYSVAFSPDGNTLAASSADKTIWLWDTKDPRQPVHLATLTAASGAVHSVKFSPDGRTIAGGSADRTARLWIIDPGAASRYICEVVGEQITEAEWRQYISGLPYQNIC